LGKPQQQNENPLMKTTISPRVMDITDIPMARGSVYLAVVLDWFSRRVLS